MFSPAVASAPCARQDGRPRGLELVAALLSAPLRLWREAWSRSLARQQFAYVDRRVLADIGLDHRLALAAFNGHLPRRALAQRVARPCGCGA